jgi:hypothetical protein
LKGGRIRLHGDVEAKAGNRLASRNAMCTEQIVYRAQQTAAEQDRRSSEEDGEDRRQNEQ